MKSILIESILGVMNAQATEISEATTLTSSMRGSLLAVLENLSNEAHAQVASMEFFETGTGGLAVKTKSGATYMLIISPKRMGADDIVRGYLRLMKKGDMTNYAMVFSDDSLNHSTQSFPTKKDIQTVARALEKELLKSQPDATIKQLKQKFEATAFSYLEEDEWAADIVAKAKAMMSKYRLKPNEIFFTSDETPQGWDGTVDLDDVEEFATTHKLPHERFHFKVEGFGPGSVREEGILIGVRANLTEAVIPDNTDQRRASRELTEVLTNLQKIRTKLDPASYFSKRAAAIVGEGVLTELTSISRSLEEIDDSLVSLKAELDNGLELKENQSTPSSSSLKETLLSSWGAYSIPSYGNNDWPNSYHKLIEDFSKRNHLTRGNFLAVFEDSLVRFADKTLDELKEYLEANNVYYEEFNEDVWGEPETFVFVSLKEKQELEESDEDETEPLPEAQEKEYWRYRRNGFVFSAFSDGSTMIMTRDKGRHAEKISIDVDGIVKRLEN